MKIVIWGAGRRGIRIATRLREEEVVAFIDSDRIKIGKVCNGKKVISIEEYIEKYSKYFILISPIKSEGIKRILHEAGICQYFELGDCPSELQGVGNYENFDEYIQSLFKQDKRYGVYGMTFYSIYFYKRLLESGYENLFLLPENDCDMNLLAKIRECFDYIHIIPDKNWKQYIDCVLVTVDRAVDDVKSEMQDDLEIFDVFDFMPLIPEYRNLALQKFKNKNFGERCFIVATGPSLRIEDLDVLNKYNEQTIGVNRIYLAFDKTCWKPDYYIASDQYCISESESQIKSISVPNKFISDTFSQFWKSDMPENIYRYHCHWLYTKKKLPAFSEQIEYGMYACATVTYEAIQLAVYLGFEKIYLLGVDFSFSEDYKSCENHFSNDYYNENSKTGIFAREEMLQSYRAAKKYADEHGIKIYNATRGGKLEVFERVDFDSLFKE